MRLIQVVVFLAFSKAICQDDPIELGIGFAVVSNPYQFEDGSHFTNLFTDKGCKTKLATSFSKQIQPYLCKPDYGLYHFICISKSEKAYEVLINNSTKAYILNDENFYFVSWEAHLMNKIIERLSKNNPIYSEPSSKGKIIEYNCSPERFKVDEVIEINSEYWVSVSYLVSCEDPNELKLGRINGWIKWRTKNELLINIFLLC